MTGKVITVAHQGPWGPMALLFQSKPQLLTHILCSPQLLLYCAISGGDKVDGVMASLARREDRWLHDVENCNPMTIDFFAVGRTPRHAIPVLSPTSSPPVRSPTDRQPPEPSSRPLVAFAFASFARDGTVSIKDGRHRGHWSRLHHLAPDQSSC